MLPVINTPNDDHVEAHTLASERPKARGARLGFWRSLAYTYCISSNNSAIVLSYQ